jgi:hypothetical protein
VHGIVLMLEKEVEPAIHNKHREMLTKGDVLHYDNA